MKAKNLLFPHKAVQKNHSLLLLALRLFFGSLFMMHGYEKYINYATLRSTFPDPLSIGSEYSLILAIFGELFCPLAFIFGFLYRLGLIPMITTMSIAFFLTHHGSIKSGESALVYLIIFILAFLSGPGKYSFDYLIGKKSKSHR